MKTLVCIAPGQFEYMDGEMPVLEGGFSIIKIKRIGICGTDLHAFEGTQPFFSYPRILGHELAAEFVEGDAIGFEKGDKVTIIPYLYCGDCVACRVGKTNCCTSIKVCGVHIDGGMAEFYKVPSYALLKGNDLSFEQLALVEPLAIGAHGIRRADVKDGEFVLIVGAGPIGLGAAEFARIAGGKVIVLDINDQRLQFCKEKLHVDFAINAIKEDVLARLIEITHGDMPTVVIDATGSQKAINNSFNYMAHGARYVLIGLQKGDISFSHPEFHKREGTLMSSRNATTEDFDHVMSSLRSGKVNPDNYITHNIPFENLAGEFESLLDLANGVIKAMATID
ncbi:zinc-binding alcohol dehydrogenase family protein [Rhizosphaericola mali]|uniref:Zinc-binding alcohol dehydrogenase family protein n=1 Tax=Rhizosphaericola mali TaxID=2545455 RepID=A0A5P2FYH8_9BACT|nr:zinc-binding alcohol dehydrogenase family protein [Rhizosphaericola mali]QES88594.1 zinc-binding alcohol dehydrogenase family protein [Rhizosphaericola mali]